MRAAFDPNARKRPVNLTRNEDLVDSAVTDVTDSVEADAPCGNLATCWSSLLTRPCMPR
jgi:hypothetical protein